MLKNKKSRFNKFANIFNVKGRQVLAYKDYDGEEDMFLINILVDSEKLSSLITFRLMYMDLTIRDDKFSNLKPTSSYLLEIMEQLYELEGGEDSTKH